MWDCNQEGISLSGPGLKVPSYGDCPAATDPTLWSHRRVAQRPKFSRLCRIHVIQMCTGTANVSPTAPSRLSIRLHIRQQCKTLCPQQVPPGQTLGLLQPQMHLIWGPSHHSASRTIQAAPLPCLVPSRLRAGGTCHNSGGTTSTQESQDGIRS